MKDYTTIQHHGECIGTLKHLRDFGKLPSYVINTVEDLIDWHESEVSRVCKLEQAIERVEFLEER